MSVTLPGALAGPSIGLLGLGRASAGVQNQQRGQSGRELLRAPDRMRPLEAVPDLSQLQLGPGLRRHAGRSLRKDQSESAWQQQGPRRQWMVTMWDAILKVQLCCVSALLEGWAAGVGAASGGWRVLL